MSGFPETGDLFATNQVSPDTERCYRYQLRNFAHCGTLVLEGTYSLGDLMPGNMQHPIESFEGGFLWTGNSAKAKIIWRILAEAAGRSILVFDYGCGAASQWRQVLSRHPNLRYVGYDPDERSVESARKALDGLCADVYTGKAIDELSLEADYVVSLSVFEHILDRVGYLNNAKRFLLRDGTFFLNYDDGHFRNLIDLDRPETWYPALRVWIHNKLSRTLAVAGNITQFQSRVGRFEVDQLVESAGFIRTESFYSNLRDLKELHKNIDVEKRADLMDLWVVLEDALNSGFIKDGSSQWGDKANLWRVMGSRTLVLRQHITGK